MPLSFAATAMKVEKATLNRDVRECVLADNNGHGHRRFQ